MNKKIRIFVTNYKEFSEAIQGEQCIKGAYSEHQLMEFLNENITSTIDDFGEQEFDRMVSYFQLDVSNDWDKVYLLKISKVIRKDYVIIIHLKFVGFLK